MVQRGDVKECRSCGANNRGTNKYCIECGVALTDNTEHTSGNSKKTNVYKLCSGCRTANQPEFSYCYRCGLQLSQQLFPDVEVGGNPAGFWIRLIAFLVDYILLSVAGILITAIFIDIDADPALSELFWEASGWTTVIVTAFVSAAYYTITVGLWGQTLGKSIFGLKITRTNGSRISYVRAFVRYWAYMVSFVPLGIGFVAIALSSQKRGWHDLICDTRVVRSRSLT